MTLEDYKESFDKPRVCRGSYAEDFAEGWRAAQDLPDLPKLCKATADRLFGTVSSVHGCLWIDGFCAAIDNSRGHETYAVQAARLLGL